MRVRAVGVGDLDMAIVANSAFRSIRIFGAVVKADRELFTVERRRDPAPRGLFFFFVFREKEPIVLAVDADGSKRLIVRTGIALIVDNVLAVARKSMKQSVASRRQKEHAILTVETDKIQG